MTDPTFMGRYLRGSWTRHVPTKAGHRTLTRTSRLLRKAHKSRAACPLPQPSGRGTSPGGAAPFILCLQPVEALLSCQMSAGPLHPPHWAKVGADESRRRRNGGARFFDTAARCAAVSDIDGCVGPATGDESSATMSGANDSSRSGLVSLATCPNAQANRSALIPRLRSG